MSLPKLFRRKIGDQLAELPLVLGVGDVVLLDGIFYRVEAEQITQLPVVKTQPPEVR